MTTVTVADIRACGYCTRGSRDFFRREGLDWQSFVTHGIAAEELAKLNNSMVDAVIEAAKQRNQRLQQ